MSPPRNFPFFFGKRTESSAAVPENPHMSAKPSRAVEVNRDILEMEYAVRGPIPRRAAELKRRGRRIIPCNMGNPQALGQKPISFYRQVMSLAEYPPHIEREKRLKEVLLEKGEDPGMQGILCDHALEYAGDFLDRMETGLGAYSESKGALFIREAISRFIDDRDGAGRHGVRPSDPEEIFITNGASEGAKYVIEALIAGRRDGIMIPIPQYPLYSATIRRCGGVQVGYYPDEESGWTFDRSLLDESLDAARSEGVNVKAIVVINPGNPTGAILDEKTVAEVIEFAGDSGLAIIADEVYQDNLYGAEFVSFARMLGDSDVPLFSLHSVSKSFLGECGHRGGYLEVRNSPEVRGAGVPFTEVILKQASVSLCPNTAGQLMVYLMVNPPEEGSDARALLDEEKRSILDDLHEKAVMIRRGFEHMDSVECYGRTGAMYLFPRLGRLPAGSTDFDYCMKLLETTGLSTVNGSGFGQREGTHHLRIAFLPPQELIREVMPSWIRFHDEYVNEKLR